MQNAEAARGTSSAPQNLVEFLVARAAEPARVAITYKKDSGWAEMTFPQALEEVQAISAGLVGLGLQRGDRVGIFGGTTLTWMLCDLAVSAAGGITVPIYASNTPDEVRYILKNSGASFLFVDDDAPAGKQPGRLTRVRQRMADCPSVKKVVAFDGAVSGEQEMLLSDLRAKGAEAHKANPGAFAERAAAIKADDLCHHHLHLGHHRRPEGRDADARRTGRTRPARSSSIRLMQPNDSVMLFLPLAHASRR